MKLRFDQLTLFLDDMGGIRFFEKNRHDEFSLGKVDDEGQFTASSWLDLDETGIAELRSHLEQAYLGEQELYITKPQLEWHAGIVKFLQLPEAQGIDLQTRYDHGEFEFGERRRYQREDGKLLNGVYADPDVSRWLLINAGILVREIPLRVTEEQDGYGHAQYLVKDQHAQAWKKSDFSEESMEKILGEAVLQGETPSAELFVGRKKIMLDWAERSEVAGLEVQVFAHRSDEEKYRLIISSPKVADAWLPADKIQTFFGALRQPSEADDTLLADLLQGWSTWSPKTSLEASSEAVQKFMSSFWKAQPLNVALDTAYRG